jgi:AraC-like DNA-binding protein
MDLGARHDSEADPGFDRLHADLLRFFPDLVTELGGDPCALLRRVDIEPALLAKGALHIGYRAWVNLMGLAAEALGCPDFGLRLASRQGGAVFGPMGAVMRNSRTFGDALDYFVAHSHAHSLAARVRVVRDPVAQTLLVCHDILTDRMPNGCQAMEQLLLLGHLNALETTGGRARVREARLRHRPLSPLRTYRRYFGCNVRFDQQEDGTLYSERDLLSPIVNADAGVYMAATALIDSRFPRTSPPMHAQVRGAILQYLGTDCCTNDEIAAELNLHPRTLHRRLKMEGTTFQELKDEVRRDVALYYLQRTDRDLTQIAQKLGYAEHSVFTRSCVRWFHAPPSHLRAQAGPLQPTG